MPNFIPSITINQVIVGLSSFLTPFLPVGTLIIRAQTNRVPMPKQPCVVLTELLTTDLATPLQTYDLLSTSKLQTSKRIDVQIDFYGPDAGDYCNAVKTVFRSSYATEHFPSNVVPLYCSDGIQSPMITAEQQWQSRWTLTASLQYNPAIDTPQQFADVATVDQIINVEVTYPI
jgi:hypothetical protein